MRSDLFSVLAKAWASCFLAESESETRVAVELRQLVTLRMASGP